MDMPECPVCLQIYDEHEAIPRVLPCGHSACSSCLDRLSSSSAQSAFADTIRCPACNQIVPYSRSKGPTALPKNIDLLRFCAPSPSSRRVLHDPEPKQAEFLKFPCDDSAWGFWKDFIIPADAISTEFEEDVATATLARKIKENQTVRLLKIGEPCSQGEFKLSYVARAMDSLRNFKNLDLIVDAPNKQRRGLCEILGLWMMNSSLFLVGRSFPSDLSVFLERNPQTSEDFGFVKVGLETCEAMVGLHSQGLACGCLALSCFRLDSYGHFSLDLIEVLQVGRRLRESFAEAHGSCTEYFVSPELKVELLSNESDSRVDSAVGFASDVWALACMLVFLVSGDVTSSLRKSFQGTRFEILVPVLESCLNPDPESRPGVHTLWRSFISLASGLENSVPFAPETLPAEQLLCCLVSSDLCRAEPKEEAGAESAAELRTISLKGHQDFVSGIVEEGGFLFSGSYDKTVRVWSLQDLTLVRTLRGAESRVMAVAVARGGGKRPICVAGDGGGFLYAWDVAGEGEMKKWRHHSDWRYSGVHSLAASRERVYSGGGDRTIKAWSLEDLGLVGALEGHQSAVSCLAASEGVLYSGSWDGTVRLWSLHDHTSLAVVHQAGASVLSLSVSGGLLAASFDGGDLLVWREGALLASAKPLGGAIFAVALHGRRLFAGGWDGTVLVQDLQFDECGGPAEMRLLGSISSDSVVTSLLHCRGMLFVGSNGDIKVHLQRGESGRE
ncbi:zinc ion binding protein [Wolffia australiana]